MQIKNQEAGLNTTPKTTGHRWLRRYFWICASLLGLVWAGGTAFADSISVSETWKDHTVDGFYSGSTDNGTFGATLTVPGLSTMSVDDWSNLSITINASSSLTGGVLVTGVDAGGSPDVFSDFMGDATTYGGTLTATTATFYFQLDDTNGMAVNAYQMTFSRSGNTLTISGKTLNPPSLATLWSILAANYFELGGPIEDSADCEIIVQNQFADDPILDVFRTVPLTGSDSYTTDLDDEYLDQVTVNGLLNFSVPTVTSVSPAASLTTTNELLNVEVKAADSVGVANVEFYVNGVDYGSGIAGNGGLWSMMFALQPGTNFIQTQATDMSGSLSLFNDLTVTRVNSQTNANLIAFTEHWLDSSQTDTDTNVFVVNQDVGVLNGAIQVAGLQNLPATTWSNLVLTVSFGDLYFSNSLAQADVLTANSAAFITYDPLNDSLIASELTISRAGNTLFFSYRTGNPTYDSSSPIIADFYLDQPGPVQDSETFLLSLGDNVNQYANIGQQIYINGTDSVTFDSQTNELDNVQISGLADFVPPTNAITAPLSGEHWSNAVFTVTGKAGDNVGVAEVFVQVNGGGWNSANSGNGWTNWTATATLTPGTNLIQAYALDVSGNVSKTNTVSFVYVLSAPLTLNVGVGGSVAQYYNGELLPIGQTFSITAKTNVGFAFSGWTGSIATNKPTLTFVMASNLVFTASFTDVQPPTNDITAPLSGEHWSNAVFTVTGKAHDNVGVAEVFVQVNGGGWNSASTGNGWTNWTATATLTPGTNLIQAYAMDGSGNVSKTNTVNFVYVLSAPLTLNVGVGGSVPQYYNGELLPIGQIFSITAKTNVGFVFSGWTGSITTNKPTLTFVMASNLVLTASFTDVQPPTNDITAPISGEHWSNVVFNVTGKAGDNLGVADVFVQVNGGGWNSANSGNGWTNWTATATLTPGTNLIQAYALDVSGNVSKTNTVSFVYVLSAPLTLNVGVGGSVAQYYNGELLPIGQTFSITAKTNVGFVFSGWTGSIATNKPTLTFVMASNLVFTASFTDVQPPTNDITAPLSGEHWSNAVFTVTGKAHDNVGVAEVFVQVNGGGWNSASTGNGWTNWTATATLTPGTNLIQAYAMDGSGNVSKTNTVNFVYVLSAPLTLNVGVGGSVPQYYNGELLPIGQIFSITAKTNVGFVFSGWTGSITTNKPTLTFVMASNLVLTASFTDVQPPTNDITAPISGEHWSNVVFNVTGKAGDNLGVADVFVQVNGGGWNSANSGNGWTNWTATATLTPGTNLIQAYALDVSGNVSKTNTVSFVYVLSAPLTLNVGVGGSVAQYYNGELLPIGQTFSITAKTNVGFVFSGWTGSISTNKPTLTFVMASNLVFTASFTDVQPPTNEITAPISGERWSNAVFNVTGKAGDNVGVTDVLVQVNGGGWNSANTGNGWTNWTATASLTPGTNLIQAYAVDLSGNLSKTNSVKFIVTLPGSSATTLLVNTFLPNDLVLNAAPSPAGSGVIIYTNGVQAALSDSNGTALFDVSPGTNLVTARLYPFYEGQAQLVLPALTNATLNLVLDDGGDISEDVPLSLDELQNDVLRTNITSFTLRFYDAASATTVALESLDQVEILDPNGGPSFGLMQDFALLPDGRISCVNLPDLTSNLWQEFGAVTIYVHGNDTNGLNYDGTVTFYLQQFEVLGQLLAPPSFPALDVSGITVTVAVLGTPLTFQAVSDSNGAFDFDMLPAGDLSFYCETNENGSFYYGQGTVVVDQSLYLGVNMLQAQDVTNGVPPYTTSPFQPAVVPLSTPQAKSIAEARKQLSLKLAPPRTGSPKDTGTEASVSVTAADQDDPITQSQVLIVPQGTKTVTLTYNAQTAEYPVYVDAQSIFNDVWSVSVLVGDAGEQLFYIAREVNSQLFGSPTWQPDGSTGPIENVLDVSAYTVSGDAIITLSASAMNVGDSVLPTSVTATVDVDQTLSIDSVVPDVVSPTTGDSTFYSIPRPGQMNVYDRYFQLLITKPTTATIKNLKVTLMGSDGPLMTLLNEGLGDNVVQVDSGVVEVRVSLHDYASTISSQPPPTDQLTYEFDLTCDNNGTPLEDTKDSGACHALWRMPDGMARYGPAGTSPGDAGRDTGGDDWCSQATYGWLLANASLVTAINDISGEHARNLGHATHQYGTDIDIFHFYTFAGAVSGTDNYYKLQQATLLAAQTSNPASVAAKQSVAAWVTATRAGLDALGNLSTVRQLFYIKGYAAGGLPEGWGAQLLTTGATTVGQGTLDLGLGAWTNAKYIPRQDHDNHIHITLDRTQLSN